MLIWRQPLRGRPQCASCRPQSAPSLKQMVNANQDEEDGDEEIEPPLKRLKAAYETPQIVHAVRHQPCHDDDGDGSGDGEDHGQDIAPRSLRREGNENAEINGGTRGAE